MSRREKVDLKELPPRPERPLLEGQPRRTQIPEQLGSRLPAPLARVLPSKLARKRGSTLSNFDKVFPVFISSDLGIANGVGRNISEQGMFIETREPCPMGSRIRITFTAPAVETELDAIADVRFQAYLNFSGEEGEREGIRGMGVRFVRFEEAEPTSRARQPTVGH